MSGTVRRRRRRVGRVLTATAVVLAVGAAAAAASGVGFGLRDGENGAQGPTVPLSTAKVTRQTLVDTQTESGELGYGAATSVVARLLGTVTGMPATGAAVKRGQALYRVDNTPVVLLYGSLPAYRVLSTGVTGADVKQFEQNLYALGYRGFTVDDTYSSGTAVAVKRWQDDLGLTRTGVVELGRVVYAAGPVRVDTRTASVGSAVQPGAPVLDYTSQRRVVTVQLDPSDQRLARTGAAVTVTLPDATPVAGTVAATQTVTVPAQGQEPASTKVEVTVTVADEKPFAGLDDATVDVVFAASKRDNVLTVPVAALLALAEGGYGVQVIDGTTSRIVAVETGLFASGRVEVSGAGLTEGMTVGMPG